MTDVIILVRNLSSCKTAGVDAIWPEMLKSLDKLEVVWFTFFGRSGAVPLDWHNSLFLNKGDQRVCSNYKITLPNLLGKSYYRVLERGDSRGTIWVPPRAWNNDWVFRLHLSPLVCGFHA